MSFRTIGILSIGEMGFHWAKLLKSHGVEVLTYDKDRGEVSRKRGQNAGVKATASMAELVQEFRADRVHRGARPRRRRVAEAVAAAVKESGRKDLLFLDANAISPMTADDIAAVLHPAGVNFVDGCIIGSAAQDGQRARSSMFRDRRQSRLRGARSRSIFRSRLLGRAPIRRRRSKSSTRGSPRGCRDLFCELFMGARRFGLLKEMTAQYEESFPGLIDKVSSSIVGLQHPRRAARRGDGRTQAHVPIHHGIDSFMAPAAQKVLESIAALKPGQASDSGARQGDLPETLELFYRQGSAAARYQRTLNFLSAALAMEAGFLVLSAEQKSEEESRPMSRVEKETTAIRFRCRRRLMKALISNTRRSTPALRFAAFTIRSSTMAATTSRK